LKSSTKFNVIWMVWSLLLMIQEYFPRAAPSTLRPDTIILPSPKLPKTLIFNLSENRRAWPNSRFFFGCFFRAWTQMIWCSESSGLLRTGQNVFSVRGIL
jgi:hypothetical protein